MINLRKRNIKGQKKIICVVLIDLRLRRRCLVGSCLCKCFSLRRYFCSFHAASADGLLNTLMAKDSTMYEILKNFQARISKLEAKVSGSGRPSTSGKSIEWNRARQLYVFRLLQWSQ